MCSFTATAFSYEIPTLAERRLMVQEYERTSVRKSEAPHSEMKAVHSSGRSDNVLEVVVEPNIFPEYEAGTVVVRTGARILHFIESDGNMTTYPIAVGREGAQWLGVTHVTGKRKNPEWRPTPNMRKRDPKLPAVVKPGPSNPLGLRAIYLSEGYLRIHGTNQPSSIGKAASSGCYRMLNEHVVDLYEKVSQGATVVVLK